MTESKTGTQKIGPASAGKALVRDDIYRPDCHPARTRKGEDAGPNEIKHLRHDRTCGVAARGIDAEWVLACCKRSLCRPMVEGAIVRQYEQY